jgi:transcriptional regulator with XRE-family HTH domain
MVDEKMSDKQTIHVRLKQVRKSINFTQKKFSERIAISYNYLAEMELGKKPVNERIIRLVSMEFGIDEYWLRTGEGSMLNDEADAKTSKLISLFKSLNPQYQDCALNQLSELSDLYISLSKKRT